MVPLMPWDNPRRIESWPRKGTRLPARQPLQGMRFRHTRSVESTWRDGSERGRKTLGAYLVRRFGMMLLTLVGISIIIFMLLRLTPGNIADILFDAGGFVDPADKAR